MTGPLRSKKVRDHARGQPCTLRFEGVCDGGGETTVYAHIRDRHKGMGQKASDSSGCFACGPCHQFMDERFAMHDEVPLASYQLRALQETWEILIRDGIIFFPIDPPTITKSVTVRKPPEARKKIPARKKPWPKRAFQRSKNA